MDPYPQLGSVEIMLENAAARASRHAAPVVIAGNEKATRLSRLTLGLLAADGGRREDFVQELVHEHPGIIPMAEIEPAFSPLISVCRELPTSAGFLDNLWLTPAGGIVLGECKLMKNPQARREVVAQALDYAQAMHGWHYDDLERAVQQASKDTSLRLWSMVQEHSDLEESQFVDAVERRLRFGRFLILIIGDGIQEGVEALTGFLQLHAGLHTSIALLDLSIWQDGEDRLIVVPRIPLRTVLVERGIVLVDANSTAQIKAVTPVKGLRRIDQ